MPKKTIKKQSAKKRINSSVDRNYSSISLPIIDILVANNHFFALLDTGASSNYCCKSVAQKLLQRGIGSIVKTYTTAILADGRQVCVRQRYSTVIKILNFTWKMNFLIIKDLPYDFLIGSNTLKKTQARIDFCNKNISFPFNPPNSIPFVSHENIPNTNYIHCATEEKFRLSEKQETSLSKLITKYDEIFSNKAGRVKNYTYQIYVKDNIPVRQSPYPLNPVKAQEMQDHIQELMEQKIVRPSRSPYSAPAFLIQKKGGGKRLCIDYRRINQKIIFDAFPPPHMDSIFQSLHGSSIFTILDLTSAFYQLNLSPSSKKYTAFTTPMGQFEFNQVPFGLNVSPQALNRIIQDTFADVRFKFVVPYFDDLLVHSANFKEHLEHLDIVFNRLQEAGFTINPEKMKLCRSRIKFLGHVISAEGMSIDPERANAIQNMPIPRNLRQVQSFLGMAGFFARYIPGFSTLAAPLHRLKKKNVKFKISGIEIDAINNIKKALQSPLILKFPDFNKMFTVQTDASSHAMGGVLLQQYEDGMHPVYYASKKFDDAQMNYTTYEREACAIIWALERFKQYLQGQHFILQTDNAALMWLHRHPKNLGRVGRWLLKLSKFDYEVQHIKGESNVIADALSRLYQDEDNQTHQETETEHLNLLQDVPLSFVSIQQHQTTDPDCELIRTRIHSGEDVDNFVIKDGLLVKQVGRRKLKRIVIPSNLKQMVIYYFHNTLTGAHQGVTKTYRHISKRFWWQNLYQDVRNYIRSCDLCQQCKAPNRYEGAPLASTPPTSVWSKIYIDHIGPLINSSNNNRYCLVVIDAYSKWLDIIPVRRATAAVTVNKLTNLWSQFGPPNTIVSDNARSFTSTSFTNMCLQWGIKHVTTSPYRPAGNLAERPNRDIKAALTIILKQYEAAHKDWDNYISYVKFSHNAGYHESTKASPAAIFLGRELPQPLDRQWKLDIVLDATEKPTDAEVEQAIRQSRAKYAKYYNLRRPPSHNFTVGQLVLQRLHGLPGFDEDQKFVPRWSTPRRVIRFTTPVSCEVEDIATMQRFRAHIEQLKPYSQHHNPE